MTDRANIFGDADFDLTDFTPAKPAPAAPPEAVRQVAERAEFTSREPERKRPSRSRRTYRTGRNGQFSIKADPLIIDRFYAISDERKWVLGETLERSVAALERELTTTAKR
jgi:hypothetical protein